MPARRTLLERLLALSDAELRDFGWSRRTVRAGVAVCREGEPANTLYVVISGTLDVRVGDTSVDELGIGSAVGEASVFFRGEHRRATIIAKSNATLFRLHRTTLRQLRAEGAEVYDWLIESALDELWRHLERKDREIVEQYPGDADIPVSRSPSVMQRLWKRVRESDQKPPPAADALQRIEALAQVDPPLLLPIAAIMRPKLVEADRALFFEGDVERTVYLVAAGELTVMRSAFDGTARELTRSGPGVLVGIGGFLTGHPRSASVVAAANCWVFGIEASDLPSLPFFSRRLLQEALLWVMRMQLAEANDLAARLQLHD